MTSRRLPAEWETQSGIMLTWPHANTDWRPVLEKVEPTFAQIAAHTSRHEKVLIVANSLDHQVHIGDRISAFNPEADNIVFAVCDSNDSWARDHAPITVMDSSGGPVLLDFQFNAWGGKYSWELDNEINSTLSAQQCFRAPMEPVNFILEGGSIESNGQGSLLSTASCLLSPDRNKGWTQQAIETELKKQLGIRQIHWLQQGHIEGDDTDAHIDTLARFISDRQIMHVICEDKQDSHFDPLWAMRQELSELETLDGEPYELIALPLPQPIYNKEGDRLPATYANFLIINDAVLVPVYEQEADTKVIDIFIDYFPAREIIAINCLPLIEQFGSLHCVTMQFPAGVLSE